MPEAGPGWLVPLADVTLGDEETAALAEVLKSGWLSQGPRTREFEERFAAFLGIEHALAVANGTAALHLALEAVGLAPGDEVLCPALTFVACANAILYAGARPVFVDLNGPHDLNLSVADAAAKLTGRTRAILAVHYGGYPCDLDGLRALAAQYNLKIIEDCAHAPGAIYHSQAAGPQMAGTVGLAGCFSFFANKNMTTGEGGMVVTRDAEVAEKLRLRRSHGMTSLTWDRHRGHSFSYDVVARGYNYRLDEMRATLGLVQLGRLPQGNARRRRLTLRYHEQLRGIPALELPFAGAAEGGAHHLFPVLLPEAGQRPEFMAHLARCSIQTSIHYPPIPTFSHYRRLWAPGFDHRLPLTREVAARLVTLPLFPTMTPAQQEMVVSAVRDFFASQRS
jgi:dTDP-4-amino-4,6-dideoxygalactose transaminase